MPRTVSIGEQDFEELITRNNFYVDKTNFIKEWWESGESGYFFILSSQPLTHPRMAASPCDISGNAIPTL